MIGYYAHHVGLGHVRRAAALAECSAEPVTVLSSAPPPHSGVPWLRLVRDDRPLAPGDPSAGGRLHWAPLAHEGVRRRAHQVSHWIESNAPRVLVADVSVEIALLARLHGTPVVSVVVPGRRDDEAHLLGFDVSDALVGMWPAGLTDDLLPGLPKRIRERITAIGAWGPRPGTAETRPACVDRHRRRRRVTLLLGAGGHTVGRDAIERAEAATPEWSWTVLDGRTGRWLDDPWPAIAGADVVVTHAGQTALAEVAAARRPAIVVPQPRPHDEQHVTARALQRGRWPVLVREELPVDGWPALLASAADLDGSAWQGWCDGGAGRRLSALLADVGATS